MMPKNDIFKLDTRKKIYDYILKYPGLHLRELSRKTNIPLGSLRYNLDYLEKLDLIRTKYQLKYRRYYVKYSVGKDDKKILNLLRQETTLRIIIMLLTPGPGHIYIGEENFKKALNKHETFEKTYTIKEIIDLTKNWGKSVGDNFFQTRFQTQADNELIETIKHMLNIKDH